MTFFINDKTVKNLHSKQDNTSESGSEHWHCLWKQVLNHK